MNFINELVKDIRIAKRLGRKWARDAKAVHGTHAKRLREMLASGIISVAQYDEFIKSI